MTKVIFIATLSLLTALRAAGVPLTPAAPEPWRAPLEGESVPPSAVTFNRLDKVEVSAISVSVSVGELRPASEQTPFPAADQAQRAAVLSSTSIEVARCPGAQGRGKRERRFGPQQKFFRRTQAWLDRKQPQARPASAPAAGVAGRNPNERTGRVARGRPLRWI